MLVLLLQPEALLAPFLLFYEVRKDYVLAHNCTQQRSHSAYARHPWA